MSGFLFGYIIGQSMHGGPNNTQATALAPANPSHEVISCPVSTHHPGLCADYIHYLNGKAVSREQFAGSAGYRCFYASALVFAAEQYYALEVSRGPRCDP